MPLAKVNHVAKAGVKAGCEHKEAVKKQSQQTPSTSLTLSWASTVSRTNSFA